jgi:hypothetical protein
MFEKCSSSLLRSHRWLEMAARACPGAAAGSKWPFKLAPERRMLEKCCSSLARSRKMLEKCCSSLPRSRRMLETCRSSLPRSDSMRSKSTVFYSSVIGSSFCSAPFCSVGLGLAGALELAARTLSASLRRRPGRAERKRTDPDKPSLPGDASQGGAADGSKWPVELAPESPQLARNGRSSLPLSRRLLEKCCSSLARSRRMLEQCRPEPQNAREVLLEPSPEPQSARKARSSLLQSHRKLEKCCSSLLRSHRWLEMAARACPGAAAGSKSFVAAQACP